MKPAAKHCNDNRRIVRTFIQKNGAMGFVMDSGHVRSEYRQDDWWGSLI